MMRDTLEIQTRVTQEQAARIAELEAENKRLKDKYEPHDTWHWATISCDNIRMIVFRAGNGTFWRCGSEYKESELHDISDAITDPLEAKYDE